MKREMEGPGGDEVKLEENLAKGIFSQSMYTVCQSNNHHNLILIVHHICNITALFQNNCSLISFVT